MHYFIEIMLWGMKLKQINFGDRPGGGWMQYEGILFSQKQTYRLWNLYNPVFGFLLFLSF